MDAGLSKRVENALKDIVPRNECHAPPRGYDASTAIDLSSAQNEVLRPELLEFFKTVVETKMSEKEFEMPESGGGNAALRTAMAHFFNTYFKPIHPVTRDHLVITAGASDAIESVIQSVCDDGDGVIVPGPYWFGFNPLLRLRANVSIIPAQPPTYQNYDNYLLPSLQAAYDFSHDKDRIKAVLLCNPHNPLGRCLPKKAIIECMEFCFERGLHLISDEIYALCRLNGAKGDRFVSALELLEPLVPSGAVKVDPSRVHVIWSPSKLFGSSGFRIGCILSQQNPTLLHALSLLTASHAPNPSALYLSSLLPWPQLPTLLALNSERLTASFSLLAAFLREHDVEFIAPTDGLFVFARLARNARCVEEERRFCDRLALSGVRVGAGSWFKGVEREYGWARVRFSVKVEEMRRVVERLARFMAREAAVEIGQD